MNEENVNLLEAQLKDQQNRFEAGTVPRFNVLQADVQLHNQIPQLITAQNNLRISKLQLAKTLGLDFQRRRGESPPLEVIGEMPYIPRPIELADAIELGKQRRAFLKQARANVLNQLQQVRTAAGQWLPNITTTGGGEWVSSPINSSWHDISKGWTALVQGSLPIWDSGAIAGQVIQQRALLSETKITYDDDVRQVELEIQTAYSNLQQNEELVKSQEKNVELADEALRLAKARLDAGAGVQLDVLNATVQLLTAQSTRLQALFGYNSSLAEFDRATGAQSTYTEMFANLKPRATTTKTYSLKNILLPTHKTLLGDVRQPQAARHDNKTYYTGSDVDAMGKPKETGEERISTNDATGKLEVTTFNARERSAAARNPGLLSVLSTALERNAEHEAKVSNSLIALFAFSRNYLRSFASLRMTGARRILDLRIEVQRCTYPSNNLLP